MHHYVSPTVRHVGIPERGGDGSAPPRRLYQRCQHSTLLPFLYNISCANPRPIRPPRELSNVQIKSESFYTRWSTSLLKERAEIIRCARRASRPSCETPIVLATIFGFEEMERATTTSSLFHYFLAYKASKISVYDSAVVVRHAWLRLVSLT